MNHEPSDWRRPAGIQPGNWTYINNHGIAAGYDQSLANSPLVTLDQQLIEAHLPDQHGVAIDFGCGTGRNLIPLLKKNWNVIGVDLSQPMLRQFQAKIDVMRSDVAFVEGEGLPEALLVQANLISLQSLGTAIADFGQCMFSTFGMIQGTQHRRQFLDHASRILRPGATFMVHAHNYWHSMRQPGGKRWMAGNLIAAARGKCELGDRYADYRAAQGLMLHHFSLRALRRELRSAGFAIESVYAILEDGTATQTIGLSQRMNAVGWIIAAKNSV